MPLHHSRLPPWDSLCLPLLDGWNQQSPLAALPSWQMEAMVYGWVAGVGVRGAGVRGEVVRGVVDTCEGEGLQMLLAPA